jgi:hypothetical protein
MVRTCDPRNEKGDLATSQAIATFTAMDYDVAIPLTESATYGLVVDTGTTLVRVSVQVHRRSTAGG